VGLLTLSLSTKAALFNYKAAQKEYRDLQPKASQLRVEFLQQKLLSPGLLDEKSAGYPPYFDC